MDRPGGDAIAGQPVAICSALQLSELAQSPSLDVQRRHAYRDRSEQTRHDLERSGNRQTSVPEEPRYERVFPLIRLYVLLGLAAERSGLRVQQLRLLRFSGLRTEFAYPWSFGTVCGSAQFTALADHPGQLHDREFDPRQQHADVQLQRFTKHGVSRRQRERAHVRRLLQRCRWRGHARSVYA